MTTSPGRTRLVSMVVLAIVFGSGILVGFAWDRRLDAAEAEAYASAQAEAEPGSSDAAEDGSERRRRRPMYERVEPTAEQQVRIDSIVADYRDGTRRFNRESREAYDQGMRTLVLDARAAIRGVLRPDQAQMYDSLTAASDRREEESESESRRERDRN